MWEWRVRTERPRIWLDQSRVKWLREKVAGKSVEDVQALAGPSTEGLALTYVITGDEAAGRAAIDKALTDRSEYRWVGASQVAIAYDWCHPLLLPAEKSRMRDTLVREGRKEVANRRMWRSFNSSLHLHGMELGLGAVALYHDDRFGKDALEFLKVHYKDAMMVFERLFADGEWHEGFDYNRVATYNAMRLFWAIKTASGSDLMAASVHVRNTVFYIVYGAKPNGLVYPGDNTDFPFLSDRDREALLFMTAQYGDPHAQYFLNHCQAKLFRPTRYNRWRDLLWYDPALPEEPLDSLPKSRIFRGEGLVIARSGWDWDGDRNRTSASWVTFRCGRYFGDHSHYDNNHFEIYHRGELAIDSGRYDDDWGMERSPEQVRKSEFFNYYRRAIAHNTILVRDPDEKMEMGVVNDGGQKELLYASGMRNVPEDYDLGAYPSDAGPGACDWARNPGRWDTGKMLAYAGNDLFTYACGDATKSYSEHKMKSFVRQFLFVQPNMVIVFDRVVSARADFRKTWLLHSVKEPRMLGPDGAFEVNYGAGRLVSIPVLPDRRVTTPVGGLGNEFLVDGIQYACGPNASSGRKSGLHYGEIPGAWRLEVCPANPAEEDYFLNVLYMTEKGLTDIPSVVLMNPGDRESVVLSASAPGGRSVMVTFAKGEKPGAHLAIEEGGKLLFDGDMPGEVTLEEGRR